MLIKEESKLGEIAAHNIRMAAILSGFGLDFCCGGDRSLATACNEKNLDTAAIVVALEQVADTGKITFSFKYWPLDLLADYIEKIHHKYVREQGAVLTSFLHTLVLVHGERHSELREIQLTFEACLTTLLIHMKEEESTIFPYIRQLAAPLPSVHRVAAHFPGHALDTMKEQHTAEGKRLDRLRELTNGYTPPGNACNTYITAYKALQEFDDDLRLHIHLENNVLFPKAEAVEAQLQTPCESGKQR